MSVGVCVCHGDTVMGTKSAAECFGRCLCICLWTDCVHVIAVTVLVKLKMKGRLKMDLATKY